MQFVNCVCVFVCVCVCELFYLFVNENLTARACVCFLGSYR